MRMKSLFLVVLVLLPIAGCSKHPKVSGKVVFKEDGKPLTEGTVVFSPVNRGPTAQGMIDGNGNFQLKTPANFGVPPGEYRAAVLGPTGDPDARKPTAISKKFSDVKTSGFKYNVEAGKENNFTLEVTRPK